MVESDIVFIYAPIVFMSVIGALITTWSTEKVVVKNISKFAKLVSDERLSPYAVF